MLQCQTRARHNLLTALPEHTDSFFNKKGCKLFKKKILKKKRDSSFQRGLLVTIEHQLTVPLEKTDRNKISEKIDPKILFQ